MSGLTASECPHGAVEHISVPLNRATLVLCLLLHAFATVLRASSKLHVG